MRMTRRTGTVTITALLVTAAVWGAAGPLAAQATAPVPAPGTVPPGGAKTAARAEPSSPAATPAPLPAENLAIARQIVALVLPSEEMEAELRSDLQTLVRRYDKEKRKQDAGAKGVRPENLDRLVDGMPERLLLFIQENVTLLTEAMARAYAREFSLADLKAILQFARTPAGYNFILRSSDVANSPEMAAATRAFEFAMLQLQVREFGNLITGAISDVTTALANRQEPETEPQATKPELQR